MLFVVSGALAQKTAIHASGILAYERGLEYFDKEKYGSAQRQFEKAIKESEGQNSEVAVNAQYYAALCGIELFNRDADLLLREFIRMNPESPKVKEALFQLGIYNYRKKKWDKVLHWFGKVDQFELSPNQKNEYLFKYGYSYFRKKKYTDASKKFYEVKEEDHVLAPAARYYYGHIEFTNGNYQTALKEFRKIENNKKFKAIVPYYISQILYYQKRYDELVSYAKPRLDSSKIKRKSEIARLIGDAFYRSKQYKDAVVYLELARRPPSKLDQEGEYQLAYSHYKMGKYYEAIKGFSKLSVRRDKLGQTSMYQLGDCYLRVEEKKYAKNAFLEASEMEFDPEIAEDALFNYAKLSYEVAFDPYNQSIKAFKRYLKKYPDSKKKEEVYDYMVKVYLTTKNYAQALRSIEQLETKNDKIKRAYQLITYNRATELFQNRNYTEAVKFYDMSLKYVVDKNLNAQTYYWKGEAQYRQNSYAKAIEAYKQFIFQPTAILQAEFNEANYNLGYAYFKLKDYENAQKWFRKFFYYEKETDSTRLADSYNRTGDCFYVTKSYEDALIYYTSSFQIGASDQDYALYQMAICKGLTKDQDSKIRFLSTLVDSFPNSSYVEASKYDLGTSLMKSGKDEESIALFDDIIANYPNSSFVKRGLLNKGLIHYNNSENGKALEVFKRIVADYPNYEDSKEALLGIKNIYIEQGQFETYSEFINGLDFVDLNEAELDSAVFAAAEIKYFEGKYEVAAPELEKYLSRFDPALFDMNASYYLADCYNRGGNKAKALEYYNRVIERPFGGFTERALLYASEINFQNEEYDAALSHYSNLEKIASSASNRFVADYGQMKCLFKMMSYESAMAYAQKVLASDKVDPDVYIESQFVIAKSLFAENNLDSAYAMFELVNDTTMNEMGAESMFHMAEIKFKNDSLTAAENLIYDLVNRVPNYPYWTAKGLILLADVYMATDNLFQAKATLESIINNYEGEDLVAIAKANLKKIEEFEKGQNQVEEEEVDIDMTDDIDYESLFEPEEEEEER